MITKSTINQLLLFIFFFFVASVSFALTAPICSPPACKVYTITNPNDGVQISVSDWGNSNKGATPIIFLHGYPHDQLLWLNQINSDLRDNYRLITMDWRGTGLSNKPTNPASYSEQSLADDVNAVITNLQLNKVVIVAHSAGGISLESYVKYYGTTKLKGIVITDAIVDNGVFPYVPSSVFDLIGQGANATTPDAFQALNLQFLTLSSYVTLDSGLSNFMLMQDLLMPQAARQALLGSLGTDNLNVMGSVTTKTLIIWGANDSVILVGAANYLASLMPNDKLVIMNGVGHMPMLENSKSYNSQLSSFVDKLQN